jgi:hypothetical protein
MKTTIAVGIGSALLLLFTAAWLTTPGWGAQKITAKRDGATMRFQGPKSLGAEHEELHAQLLKATQAGGKTAEAAAAVAKVLHPHFEKEEKYAQPPLGLLQQLARGEATAEMKQVLTLTEKLKADLPQMLEEHKAIVVALDELSRAAKQEGKTEHADFAEKLKAHAQTEEAVLYPAAILVGEYLKLKLKE